MEEMRRCTACKQVKVRSDFYPSEFERSRCKQCSKVKHKEWQTKNLAYCNTKRLAWAKAHPERQQAIWERYIAKPGVKEKRKASTLRWQSAQPKKDTPRRRIRLQQLGLSGKERLKATYERYVSKQGVRTKRSAAARKWQKQYPEKHAAINARRRAAKIRAVPKWANLFFISEIYDLAKLRTLYLGVPHHVDHIVPLKGKTVCGLHVEHNLRVIPKALNLKKSWVHWPDMP